MNENDLKYPIGNFAPPAHISANHRGQFIDNLDALPGQIKSIVANLSETQLDTPYRDGGWTVRQVVHHLPDSHLNSYIRFKWALTEDQPKIKAYDEKAWAMLPDAMEAPIELSLSLLESIHNRWVYLLKSLQEADWKRSFEHPETNKTVPLDLNLALYSWHGRHHLAHIERLVERKRWG